MIQIFEYQNSPIQFEVIDGHVMANATAMFKANNARIDHWKKSESAIRYIQAITQILGISENQAVVVKIGNPEFGGGTWIHEKLILNAARYISVDFELWCDEKISDLLRVGKATLENLTPAESLLRSVQQLVDHERQIKQLQSNYKSVQNDIQEITSQLTTRPDYYTIAGFASKHKIHIGNSVAKKLGANAARICLSRGIPVDKVNDTKWGTVGSYPGIILEEIFITEGLIRTK